MTDPTRTALSRPEPAGQLPPDYIDTEHTGVDRELLQTFYAACQSEGGTVDEVTLRGLRAAIAADRAKRQPEPPADGEVQELAVFLRGCADDHYGHGRRQFTRAAELLSQRYLQPVHVGEWRTGLPPFAGFYYVRGLLDQSIGGDDRAVYVNPEYFVWGFSQWDDPEWIGLDSDITPENIQWKPVSLMPPPVPVSERLPGPEDCDSEGRCWCFTPRLDFEGQLIFHSRWILSVPTDVDTHWLPAHALPLPGEMDHD